MGVWECGGVGMWGMVQPTKGRGYLGGGVGRAFLFRREGWESQGINI